VRKRWLTLAALAVATVLLASMFAAMRGSSASAAHQAAFSACLVTDIGGLNDKSFNHLAFVGLQTAEKSGVKGRVIQSKSPADYIPNLKACVQSGAGVTIGVGFLMTDAMDAIASSYPASKFAIVDVDVTSMKHKPKNVEGLLFKEQEAGYLAGYAAGLAAKAENGKAVSSVGGQKQPPVDRYIAGYEAGAKAADPGIQTINGYSQDFEAEAKCKNVALNQIAAGSVVVFQVAGGCGLGALDAAREKGVWGIGVDADQGYLGTYVLTSALKRVDTAVYDAIKDAHDGHFKGGTDAVYGLSVNGVGIGKFSPKTPKGIAAKVTQIRAQLAAGTIKNIPTTVK
jgi:basic membrane protein A and related proteins